jgi:hypothetical protein
MCCLQIRPKRQQIGWIAIMWWVSTVSPCPFRGHITRAVSCKFRANWNWEWQNSLRAIAVAEEHKQEDGSKLEEYSSYELQVMSQSQAGGVQKNF